MIFETTLTTLKCLITGYLDEADFVFRIYISYSRHAQFSFWQRFRDHTLNSICNCQFWKHMKNELPRLRSNVFIH